MLPHLLYIPIPILAAFIAVLFGASILSHLKNAVLMWGLALAMGAGASLFAWHSQFGSQTIPVQGYGVMILLGVICGVWMTARRSQLIGVEPKQCLDIGIFGITVGLIGARLLHVILNWSDFNPALYGFEGVLRMFKIWEGGLVFYGGFILVLPASWMYCKQRKIPPLPFLDLAFPGVIAGQAFGRIGCFLNGCCYGRLCYPGSRIPWAVQFPENSIPGPGLRHPSQIYASIACALTAGFLYAFWPRRQYDGQVLSLGLIMAGMARFFEESLRSDDVPAFPALSSWMTIAQWTAIPIVLTGVSLLLYFRSRQPASVEGRAAFASSRGEG